jgi:hypothetical protein
MNLVIFELLNNLMQVSKFDLSFTFKGNKLTATCHKMTVYKHPHIRVAVNREKGKTDIYIFPEINEPKQKYFWFQLSGFKEEIATIISIKLEGIMACSN